MTSIQTYLQKIPYFAGITPPELHRLQTTSLLHTYAAGEVIFTEGELSLGLFIVESGHVKIYKLSPNGNEHILRLCGQGKTFNDIGALDAGATPANAAALTHPTQLWLIPVDTLKTILLHNPVVATNVIRFLARQVRTLVGQIEDLALHSVIVRLARFLLKQAQNPDLNGVAITRTVIAAHLNTTPQTISVTLRELEAAGAIEFDRHKVLIVREDVLRTIACQ